MKISILGDIMCEQETRNDYMISDCEHDFEPAFQDVLEFLKNSDLILGNLETPLGKSDFSNHKWSFNAPKEFVSVWSKYATVFTTANNHCLDRGIKGLNETLEILDEYGISHTGTSADIEQRKPLIINIKNTKLGIISYTYGTNASFNHNYLKGVDKYKVNLIQPQEEVIEKYNLIRRAKEKLRYFFNLINIDYHVSKFIKKVKKDIVFCKENDVKQIFVYLHIGGQSNSEPEQFTKMVVSKLSNLNIDVIICNHEHVIHPLDIKTYGIPVAYSLGNFSAHPNSENTCLKSKNLTSLILNIYLDEDEIKKMTISITFSYIDKSGKVKISLLSKLINEESNEHKKSELESIYYDALRSALSTNIDYELTDEIMVWKNE